MKIKKMIESEIELPDPRPCPFCKSDRIEVHHTQTIGTYYYCVCTCCGVMYAGKEKAKLIYGFNSEEDAIRAWNGEDVKAVRTGTYKTREEITGDGNEINGNQQR